MASEHVAFDQYAVSLYSKELARTPAMTVTVLYGTDRFLSEGVAVEFVTNLFEQDKTNLPAVHITALYTEHPYPWMCKEVIPSAYCWKLELEDGTVMGFTNHDQDLAFDGLTYEAATGFSPTAVDDTADMSVDNLDVEGMLSSDKITADDISAGRYDFAKITIYLVNWQDLSQPKHIIRRGTIGQITHTAIGFTAEVRGMLEAYQQTGGEVYQKLCRAQLGDHECKVTMADKSAAGMITKVLHGSMFETNVIAVANAYDYGVLTFTNGKNTNAQVEIQTQTASGTITLYLPAPYYLAVGDTFSMVMGCDKNFSTCQTKYNNRFNFRGEPYVPGSGYSVSYPIKGTNTVSSASSAKRG